MGFILIIISKGIYDGENIYSEEKFKNVIRDEMDYRGYEDDTLRYELMGRLIYYYRYKGLKSHKKLCRKLDKFEKAFLNQEKLLEDK